MLLCGTCGKSKAEIYVKHLPALCVRCAKAVRIPLKSGIHLDYLTADGFRVAKQHVEPEVAPKVKRDKRTNVPSTFVF